MPLKLALHWLVAATQDNALIFVRQLFFSTKARGIPWNVLSVEVGVKC